MTAHFVDNNWKLNKKILNFCKVPGHSGEVMAQTVWNCLSNWELNQVLTMTVDNASSNDVGISYLKKNLMPDLVMKGKYFHTRCCAHVLNLIVKDGLKDIDNSVLRIRGAVKYIQSSGPRYDKFKSFIDPQKVEYKGFVNLDVDTRWNSTYLMLEAALKHMSTFAKLEMHDRAYVRELQNGKGLPLLEDWEYVDSILPFLALFHDATVRISGSSYATSNKYMFEVFGIGKKIREMCNHLDPRIRLMAKNMKIKYDKYWGEPNSLNMLLLIALILDPRHKMKFINWYAENFFGSDEATNFTKNVNSSLISLFNEYNGQIGESHASSQEDRPHEGGKSDPYGFKPFYKSIGRNKADSEVTKYLDDICEEEGDLDVLMWWKDNCTRYPVLARIAREVLAIPVSTVASESAFSTGGRVLDAYRSSLSATTVEALICTQDWVKIKDHGIETSSLVTYDDLNTLQQLEQGKITRCLLFTYYIKLWLDK
jgi:hypothetical protein